MQAAHYTWYHNEVTRAFLESHAAMATFEGTAPVSKRVNNVNGPAGEETRPVPVVAQIPPLFHGISDKHATTLGLTCPTAPCTGGGTAAVKAGGGVFDVQMMGNTVEAGHLIPYNYYAAKNGLGNRLAPAATFTVWHGYWWDVNNDDVIDDEWVACDVTVAGCAYRASPRDELVWRGLNTGEAPLNGAGWLFPTDSSADARTIGMPYEPAGLSGSCVRHGPAVGGPDCINPAPDYAFGDETLATGDGNANNQRYVAGSGGGRWYYEEVLIVNLHHYGLIGAARLTGSVAQFDVRCATGLGSFGDRGCFRDYDYYQAVASESLEGLWLDALRMPRDAVWVPVEEFDPLKDLLPIVPEACPTGPTPVPGCVADTSHVDAKRGSAGAAQSVQRAWANLAWWNPIPVYAGTDNRMLSYWCAQATGLSQEECFSKLPPAQGSYGDVGQYRTFAPPYNSMRSGGWLRPVGTAFVWNDLNHDGFIGSPGPFEVGYYRQGLDASPNNFCVVGSTTPEGQPCEVSPRSDAFVGKVARVTPGTLGWPPGSVVMRAYERPMGQAPFYPPGSAWIEPSTPLFGTNAVDLRFDGSYCTATLANCRTIDAVFIPTGSAGSSLTARVGAVTGTLNTGAFAPGLSLTWVEGATAFTAAFTEPRFIQDVAAAAPLQ